MPGNQDLSKSQIRYLLQQSIKKIQPERFYVDKNEQSKNPSFIGYLSTEDIHLNPEQKGSQNQFTMPVNFNIPTTKRSSDDLVTSSQQYPDQLYHQQQLAQTPNNLQNNNEYPQPQLIENYPNYQRIPPNYQQQRPQNFPQPAQNYVQPPQNSPQVLNQAIPQQYITQQQYQNLLNQNQQNSQPYLGQVQNQQYIQPITGIAQNQQYIQSSPGIYQNQQYYQPATGISQDQQYVQPRAGIPQNQNDINSPIAGLPIAPTTVPLAIPILQRFLQRPQQQPLPEQLNIQQPQQPVPLPPQIYYIPQQQAAQATPLGGNQAGALNIVPQYQQQQQQLLQPQPQPPNQANGISLRADLQDNLFPQSEDQKYQQPVFSFNEPPPPSEQQIENPPQQQVNNIGQRYPLGPGYSNQLQNQLPVNVQNLPLVNSQPVYSGQQISQGINQGQPYYSAQSVGPQGAPVQYGPQGQIPNYQDEQQQYDRPQPEQLNAQNQDNGGRAPNQGQQQSTEAPIKYNINDELPPISNFQDLLKPPPVNDLGKYNPQQNPIYNNENPPSPDRLVYTTPDPQKYEDRVVGLRPPLREQDPFMRGDPGYKPTGQPSPVVTGLRDINIIPIDLINQNTPESKESKKPKYDLPNDLFTLPVHFSTPNKTKDYQRQKLEDRLKLNAQNIQSLYDIQQTNKQNYPSNGQNNGIDNINYVSRNDLNKREHSTPSTSKIQTKVDESLPKHRTKRNYFYDPPRIPFNLPGEDSYGSDSHQYDTISNTYLPALPPSNTFGAPNYYGGIEYRYVPIYIPKPTDFFFIIRFCPAALPGHSNGTDSQNMTTVAVDTATKTTTSTTTTESMIIKDVGTTIPTPEDGNSTGNPSRCVWAIISCCSPEMLEQRSQCFTALGCQSLAGDNPCSPDVVNNAIQQASSFYQNTSDVLLREDRTRKFDDYDESGGGGNDFNQLFYDDFEVPDNITVSPDSLTTALATPTRAPRRVTQAQKPRVTQKP